MKNKFLKFYADTEIGKKIFEKLVELEFIPTK